jgi:RNA polymerase sigma factor (sigma-70 family)
MAQTMPIDPPDDEDPYRLFLENRALIDRAIESMARRLRPEEREDFSSWVILRLLENGCAVLRKCRDWDHPKTFLAAVVGNLYRDYLIRERGKYRPSKEAKNLGEPALQLERLMVRDRHTFDEACQILRINYKVKATPAELADLAGRLTLRIGRQMEGDDALGYLPSSEDTPDQSFVAGQRQALSDEVFCALSRALDALPPEDQALLRYHFEQGWTWAEVARYLRLDQKPLYGRVEKILGSLGQSLAAEGFDRESMGEVLQGLGLVFRLKRRKSGKGPSSS